MNDEPPLLLLLHEKLNESVMPMVFLSLLRSRTIFYLESIMEGLIDVTQTSQPGIAGGASSLLRH